MRKETKITSKTFNCYTYSKLSHLELFNRKRYDIQLHHKRINKIFSKLKQYQDLLIFTFIQQNIPKGSRLLEVGGGNSRLLKYFQNDYECWNIDKLEGCGNGPTRVRPTKYRLILDYMGNFNAELPENYFDLIFSVSALEHVPENSEIAFSYILSDMNRVMKAGAYSLHCFDIVVNKAHIWSNSFLPYLFQKADPCNNFIEFNRMLSDPDLFMMSKFAYYRYWMPITKKTCHSFGLPVSYNILWQHS